MINNFLHCFIMLVIIYGCGPKTASNHSSETLDPKPDFQLYIYEVLRHSDTSYIHILDKIPATEGFTKITDLDYQNYPDILAGVTNDAKYKSAILDQVNLILDDSLNLKPVWSKNRIENMRTNENNYELYLLKDNKRTLKISAHDIIKTKVEMNPYSNEPHLLLHVNEEIAKKWGNFTTWISANDHGFIALVIDEEVYFCPRVMEPITVNSMAIGFETLEEAKAMANRIKISQ